MHENLFLFIPALVLVLIYVSCEVDIHLPSHTSALLLITAQISDVRAYIWHISATNLHTCYDLRRAVYLRTSVSYFTSLTHFVYKLSISYICVSACALLQSHASLIILFGVCWEPARLLLSA
jgi:hypothetical protein